MTLTIVVAHDPNLVIGKEGGLPWRYPEDLKHFKQTTLGGTMIMGRGVFEELNEIPLPGRKNIVLTRTKTYDNVDTYTSLQIALDELDEEEIFIMADKMIVTQVNKEYDGDTYFPEYRDDIGKIWIETDRRETDDLTFLVFERA